MKDSRGALCGLALVELVFTVATIALATAVMAVSLSSAVPAWLDSVAILETATMVSDAADFILRDLRVAGFNPQQASFSALAAGDGDAVVLLADLDRDGAVDTNSQERIEYRVGAGGDKLMRVVGAQAMALVEGLEPGGFRIGYFDAAGNEITGPFPLSSAALATVSSVEVVIEAKGPGGGKRVGALVTAKLRNR